ncbi:Ltp family lipoprotein [Mycetocola zhadangensis]|uniref:Ltp family lipoprotein n=1 Tax=Mycetocola zhadangensis TaxID=1164595 RepID=UPI003A4DEF05
MTDTQHKPGDIANGHRLTEQPDGSLVWLPIAPDPQPKRKSRRGLWITLGALGAVLLLFIIIGSINAPSGNDAVPAGANTSAPEEAAPSAEPAPEPEMVAVPVGLVGMTANDAFNALAAVGLTAVYDGEATAKVLSVNPTAAEVEAGSTITLTVEQPPVLTLAQQNAVGKAKSYLALKGFSRTGLISQLEYEGFSTEDASFAADHIGPDWNTEAAESAKSYLELTSFSRQGLIDQLLYEGYTQEQAAFGVTANGY